MVFLNSQSQNALIWMSGNFFRGGEDDETPLKAAKREANEVDVKDKKLVLSSEHTEIKWLKYENAVAILKFDSNKTALYELNERLIKM